MKSVKKTGNSGKPAGSLKSTEGIAEAEPPQWALDLIAKVQNIEKKVELLWKKCDEVIDHINLMDERRFETGRKLWNTIAETSTKVNEKSLVIYGLKIPDPSVGVSTRKKTSAEKATPKEYVKKWFSEKLEVSPNICQVQILQKKGITQALGAPPPPIKVEFESGEDRKEIFENVKKLKKLKQKISICDDLPAAIRKLRSRMVEKLKQLKKQGEQVRFVGIDLYSNGVYVPPARLDYNSLNCLSEEPKKDSASQSYETDSDEFNTPEKPRRCEFPSEEAYSSDPEEETPPWVKHWEDRRGRSLQELLCASSDSSYSD